MWLIYTSLTLGLWLPSAAYLGSESEHINQAITYPGYKTLCSLILLFSKENELKSGQSHQLIPNKSSECSRSHPACKYIVIWKQPCDEGSSGINSNSSVQRARAIKEGYHPPILIQHGPWPQIQFLRLTLFSSITFLLVLIALHSLCGRWCWRGPGGRSKPTRS